MRRTIILTLFLVAFAAAYEVLEHRKNAIPNHDLDYALFGTGYLSKSAGATPHIVGGEESVPHSRPYQAGLFIPVTGGNAFCGGSLINVQTVLTAAHCVDNIQGPVEIVLGAHIINQDEPNQQVVYSSDVVIHPQWNRSFIVHDVAVIRLAEPVIINEYVSTILLPRNADHDYTGNQSLVSGWGRPADSVNTISPVLREVSSPIIPNTACYMAYINARDDIICINGHYGRGTCNGDSGGPLTVNGVQVGIVSFGSAMGCEVGWPSAFARVTSYLAWIAENSVNVSALSNHGNANKETKDQNNSASRNIDAPLDPEFTVQPKGILP